MAEDLVSKLKETLQPTGEPHMHPYTENQPQQEHVSGSAIDEDYADEPESRAIDAESGRRTQRVHSLVEGVSGKVGPLFPESGQKQQRHRRNSSSEQPRQPLDAHDAAQVPPSVFAKHVGEPSIEHAFPGDSKTKRHSSASHQEAHYNMQ